MHSDSGRGAEVGAGGAGISHTDQQLMCMGLFWPGGPQREVIVHQDSSLQAESALTIP